MKAKDLIGKLVTRTAPCNYGDGVSDFSFQDGAVEILNADDSTIALKYYKNNFLKEDVFYLGARWCDDNWKDMTEFIKEVEAKIKK